MWAQQQVKCCVNFHIFKELCIILPLIMNLPNTDHKVFMILQNVMPILPTWDEPQDLTSILPWNLIDCLRN